MEPERLVDHVSINLTPSVFPVDVIPAEKFSRVLFSCRVLLPERFIWSRLIPDLHLRRSCESLLHKLLNCYSNSKVERGQSQGERHMTFVMGYLPATLRTRFGLSDSSEMEASGRAGSSGADGSSGLEGV